MNHNQQFNSLPTTIKGHLFFNYLSINKNMDKEFYVYIHTKPGTDEVFYVGKGKGKRAVQSSGRNHYWKNIVNKHGFECSIIEIGLTNEEACQLEIYWIAQFKAWNFKLANMTNGGEGMNGLTAWNKGKKYRTGFHHSKETKEKISKANKGRIVSDETKEKLKDTLFKKGDNSHIKGYKWTEEQKKDKDYFFKKGQVAWNKGKKMSEESRKKISESQKARLKNKKNEQ